MSSPPDAAHASANTWTEPPWSGWIETTGDALLILEAARRGLIPRVTRRLVDSERKMITSGSVFVFDEDESGIKRWTDGFFWSPSRILGNFLLYRETEKRNAAHRHVRNSEQVVGDSGEYEGGKAESQALSRPRGEAGRLGIDRRRERSLVGSLTNSYKFKQGGMMKKTFSLTISGVSQHLISYYKIEDVEQGRLRTASSYPELASLDISPEYLEKTHFRNPPKVEIGVDGFPLYRGEADDVEPSPHVLNPSLSGGMPMLSDPTDVGAAASKRRDKRFEPYGGKGKRKSKSQTGQPSSPTESPPFAVPQAAAADPNMAMMHPAHFGYAPYSYPLGYAMPHPPHAMYAMPPAISPPPGSPPQAGSPSSPAPLAGFSPYMTPGDVSQQQVVYPYYPPPPGYPPYWPAYSGYPQAMGAQSVVVSPTSPDSASTIGASAVEAQIKTGDEGEGGLPVEVNVASSH
ncbi:hypothetical protein FA95DRAFT_1553129 [Auriscalpium vulgare]|uniref:Uncharacterized protein n=1 Tax=Auriscalpium vulgare TaxID=40419 RepID=A0ACB8S955_9AGAM|nr:hypothetical protein FA95DRAFT_1553129 [Auriscalpium vulgare]